MAITSEIIGKLGGGVEEAPVEPKEFTGANIPVYTVEVPPGKQVLVSFVLRFSKIAAVASYFPLMKIGDTQSICASTSYDTAISAILTKTSTLTVSTGAGINGGTLSGGTVYTAEM